MENSNNNTESEWWWIDYLENELDPALDNDLQTLLENCEQDRTSFEHFRLLKQWVKESDPVGEWPIEERLIRMRKNVMDAIQNEDSWQETPTTVRA